MCRSNKNLPILFVSTDLHMFRFAWIPDQTKNIRIFTSRDSRYSISLIKEFIEYHHNIFNQQADTNNLEDAEPASTIVDLMPHEVSTNPDDTFAELFGIDISVILKFLLLNIDKFILI